MLMIEELSNRLSGAPARKGERRINLLPKGEDSIWIYLDRARVDPLTGSNYSTWKRQITLQLGLLDFDFVLTEARPVILTAESTDVEKATFKKWEKVNKLCMMVIQGSIHETISRGIPETTTAKELFELINGQFMGNVHSRQYNCLAQLFSLYCDETGSVREHILKLSKLVINLRDLGFTIEDELMVHMAVAKLPSKFDTLKVNYSTQGRKWDLNELINICVAEEERLKESNAEYANYSQIQQKELQEEF
ncbi:hypothetical protein BVC80_1013g3 [Macleaya cordata]|uniref:Retrotransposon Copia-like N-terminal domain-containing protein n=1 Tax=Macleaya cordata TaxID=56857 RepID=A0A200QM41_MACCD|nr:hypothetical protein BVC80_1013g3 [Macleaya cordata]